MRQVWASAVAMYNISRTIISTHHHSLLPITTHHHPSSPIITHHRRLLLAAARRIAMRPRMAKISAQSCSLCRNSCNRAANVRLLTLVESTELEVLLLVLVRRGVGLVRWVE